VKILSKAALFFVVTGALSCSQTPVREPAAAPSPGRSLGQLRTAADLFVKAIPDGRIKRGLTRYFEVIGLDAYGTMDLGKANFGLNRYIGRKTSAYPCFGKLADLFAREQLNQDHDLEEKYSWNDSRRVLGRRMTLADQAGSTFKELPAGWLWRKALRFSAQDPNLAVNLIGVCGHDDTAQGPYPFLDETAEGKLARDETLKALRDQLEEAKRDLHSGSEEERLEVSRHVEELEERIQEKNRASGIEKVISCPDEMSTLYIPGSLGAAWDLSPALKAKIVSLQNRTEGAYALPAKHYHVYGAAFATCQMIQEGMPSGLAIRVQLEAARFYRGIRLCRDVNSLLEIRDRLGKDYQIARKQDMIQGARARMAGVGKPLIKFDEWVQSLARNVHDDPTCQIPTAPDTSFPWPESKDWNAGQREAHVARMRQKVVEYQNRLAQWKVRSEQRCSPFGTKLTHLQLMEKNPEELRRAVDNLLTDLNAAALYHAWYLGSQRILGAQIPCTDVRLFGPKTILPSEFEIKNNWNMCGDDTSLEACTKARRRLAVWDSDFEWTRTQHELGARFAAEVCRPEPHGSTPEARACEALRQAPPVEDRGFGSFR
jgi:hypothetical protein